MSVRLRPQSSSNVIVGHHSGGWFEIDKGLFSSVATSVATLFTSDREVKRILIPDTVAPSVFVAIKAMFHGDEVDVEPEDLKKFTEQLESIGVKVVKVYHSSFVTDDRPMVIVKQLYKLWRAIILWPRHESDRLIDNRVQPFYTSYVSKDTPCQEFKMYEKEDLVKSFAYYNIKFTHGDFRKKLTCVGPNNKTFKVKRKKMINLSTLKFKTFERYAGDINYVFLPANISEFTFDQFQSLVLNEMCTIPMEKFEEFKTELKTIGLSIEISDLIDVDHKHQYRVLARKAKKDKSKSFVYICELNPKYAINPAAATEEPVVEITRLELNDEPEPEQEPEPEPEPEMEPPKKRKCLI